jgi:SAM-dependent methyltransferase
MHANGQPDAERGDASAELREFERHALAQRPITPEHYDAAYFQAEWRADGNRYELDVRRGVEGRHPELIREVLQPETLLDLGCGPGMLLALLEELGIRADGVDYSPASLALAPASVRDRIAIAPVTDPQIAPRAYDVVMCREVLEHLTILEVRRTITAMCAASRRLVYLTARFLPEPAPLLGWGSDLDTDPTHITLLAKDLVRLLLVLEGFGQREDLEAQMDWAGFGRVLVYERLTVAA